VTPGVRSVRWARVVWALDVTLAVVGSVFLLAAGHLLDSAKDAVDEWFGGLGLVSITLACVGGLIAVRRPGNRIGWLLLGSGLVYGLIQFASGFVQGIQYAGWKPFPGLWPVAWVAMGSWVPGLGSIAILLPLLFPTGHVPSRRWRPVLWLSAVTILVMWALNAAASVPATTSAMAGEIAVPPVAGWLNAANGAVSAVAGVCMVLAVASLFVRYRRSLGVEREQLKWMAAGGLLLAIGIVASFPGEWWSALVTLAGFFAFVVCIGVAILRYRLYDIERILSRALSYALVTAVLVGVYAGVVVGLGSAFGRSGNPLLIAGGTLLVAALFGPIRRRVQALVDRRFNRRRYDAERTLAAFSARLRDEVDITELRAGLLATVGDAVQPATSGLWLRDRGRP
jgi:hypothetical protein